MLDNPVGLTAQSDVVQGRPDLPSLASQRMAADAALLLEEARPWAALGITFIEA